MKEVRSNLYSGIAFLIFGIFVFITSNMIQPTTSDILGSRFFPRAVAIAICLLSVYQIIAAMIKLKKLDKEVLEKRSFSKPLWLTIAALFIYYILVLYIGFTITSILYMLVQSAILMSKDDFKDKRKVILMIVVAVVTPIFINTVFWKIFSIALPVGKLF